LSDHRRGVAAASSLHCHDGRDSYNRGVYRFDLTIDVDAAPARVWRALCDPGEVVEWDTGVEAPLDAPSDYPRPGQHVRWRYRSRPFRILHDRPQEVVPERRLRSRLALGVFRFDETYTLEPAGAGSRLTATMLVSVALPLIGALAVRAYAGPASRRAVQASLRAIKRHCESSG
jgi:hypothetical protein